ncbi:O-antigen ligase domain-containing protein [Streptomyces antnestii]|uniref:O-antigen ligase domain-containing protein n=1 Tax=Streptomyces antnestii TaxID=2494256 RepID=A0A437PJE7_9ACTN|nr:O-antigen ligase family protein [Streptomyces sp. San01]RVU22375.1 O-antigen ligase domain-containing protein [Streptomyces sp. San01]
MSSTAGPSTETEYERHNVADVAGVVALGACAVWSLITATARAGRPEGVLLAVLAVAAGYVCGRISGALVPMAAPCAAALAELGLALASPHAVPAPDTGSPLGRTGATAALLVLATGAACCAAWATRRLPARVALFLLAGGAVVAAVDAGSVVAVTACTGVLLCSLASARMRYRGLGLAGFGLVTALVTGLALALLKGVLPSGLDDSLSGQLTQHRVLLWRDALRLTESEPGLGVGPGRFGELSPTAGETLLSDGKPHSAPLQMAAEQGLVGVCLLVAVFCWLLYVLWRSARSTPVVLTAGAALTALAALATLGNALSFTTVTAGAGLLAGVATARPWGDEPPDSITAAPIRARDGRAS